MYLNKVNFPYYFKTASSFLLEVTVSDRVPRSPRESLSRPRNEALFCRRRISRNEVKHISSNKVRGISP